MPELELDFLAVLRTLEAGSVRFVLIGGLAMIVLGSNHVTQDVDIVYARDPENLAALVAALKPQHPRLRGVPKDLPFIFDVRTFQNMFNITLVMDAGSLDLLGEAPGARPFEELWERAVIVELGEMPIHVASVDDLIAMKTAAGRLKDQAHILELRALRELRAEYDADEYKV